MTTLPLPDGRLTALVRLVNPALCVNTMQGGGVLLYTALALFVLTYSNKMSSFYLEYMHVLTELYKAINKYVMRSLW